MGTSPLQKLNLGMVTSFPLDYMHLVCLGVTKKLLITWLTGKSFVKLTCKASDNISAFLIKLRSWTPKEFAKKPRSLNEIDRWKATEFHQFLLYTQAL